MVAILYCFMNSEVRAELVQLRTKTNCCRKRRRRDRRAMTDSRDFQEMNFFSLGSSNATSKSYLPNSLEGKYSVRFIENDDTLTNSRRGSGIVFSVTHIFLTLNNSLTRDQQEYVKSQYGRKKKIFLKSRIHSRKIDFERESSFQNLSLSLTFAQK